MGTNKDHVSWCIIFVILTFIDTEFPSAELAESLMLLSDTEKYKNKRIPTDFSTSLFQSIFRLTPFLLHQVLLPLDFMI
jgi:hypothetical protein